MRHLKKFNENNTIDNIGDIHDTLLYDSGLKSVLGAFYSMRNNLNVSENELPEEARTLFNEIDSTIEEMSSELRTKILKLYAILTGDTSLNEKYL